MSEAAASPTRLAPDALPRRTLLAMAMAPWAVRVHAQAARPAVHLLLEGGAALAAPFRAGLAERGWVEGRNVSLAVHTHMADGERLAAVMREMQAQPPDVVATGTDVGAARVARVLPQVPTVFCYGLDPVGIGVVRSLARPGGSITGYSALDREIAPKRIGILKELMPRLSRLAVLYPGTDATSRAPAAGLAAVAQSLGISATPVPYSKADLEQVYAGLARQRVQASLSVPSPIPFTLRHELAALALRHRVPGIYGAPEFAEAGALVSYGANVGSAMRRGGALAGRLLRGEHPSAIPVEQLNEYEFVLNRRTATALGLVVPDSVVQQATRLIG